MHIDVRSHTDCRQTAKYNEALSDRRAKSTIAWLVKNGIAKGEFNNLMQQMINFIFVELWKNYAGD